LSLEIPSTEIEKFATFFAFYENKKDPIIPFSGITTIIL